MKMMTPRFFVVLTLLFTGCSLADQTEIDPQKNNYLTDLVSFYDQEIKWSKCKDDK
jgi:hypothetical protein